MLVLTSVSQVTKYENIVVPVFRRAYAYFDNYIRKRSIPHISNCVNRPIPYPRRNTHRRLSDQALFRIHFK